MSSFNLGGEPLGLDPAKRGKELLQGTWTEWRNSAKSENKPDGSCSTSKLSPASEFCTYRCPCTVAMFASDAARIRKSVQRPLDTKNANLVKLVKKTSLFLKDTDSISKMGRHKKGELRGLFLEMGDQQSGLKRCSNFSLFTVNPSDKKLVLSPLFLLFRKPYPC